MRKILNIILFSILSIVYCYGQETKFEDRLQAFRFSLNEVLETYDDRIITNLNFNSNDSVILMIDEFVSENKQEIKKYRESILKEYANKSDVLFDIEKYEQVDLKDLNEFLSDSDFSASVPLYQLMSINPLQEVETYRNMYFSRQKQVSDIVLFNAKRSIASSLIKTQKVGKNKWEIIENSYSIIGKYTYDLNKGSITHFEIFERKPEIRH